jgi:hypothetical protein
MGITISPQFEYKGVMGSTRQILPSPQATLRLAMDAMVDKELANAIN